MSPIRNVVQRQKLLDNLKAAIASGRLKPGQRLVESFLAERFKTTRSRVREALRRLEQDGFVKIVPNVGATVAEFSQRDVEHIYDIMSVLEGLAVRVITPFITAEQLKKLDRLISRVEKSKRATEFFERNNMLHAFLIHLTENDHLIKLTENFMNRIRCLNLQCLFSPGQMAASIREHRKIFEAIERREAVRAEQLMRNHLQCAKTRLIKFLNKSL